MGVINGMSPEGVLVAVGILVQTLLPDNDWDLIRYLNHKVSARDES